MDSTQFTPGTRIYYTGDMANQPDDGTITRLVPANKYGGASVDIDFDEGNNRNVTLLGFAPGPGRRFWLQDDWIQERATKLRESQAKMRAAILKRAHRDAEILLEG